MKFIHHMILHECDTSKSKDFSKWEEYAKHEGRPCYGSEMPNDWDKCITPVITWAIGSKGKFQGNLKKIMLKHRWYKFDIAYEHEKSVWIS